jgi:two-component system NtrC family sensor kinase
LASAPDQADIAAALNAGADEFLRKPITNAELLLRVRAMLRLKAAHEALEELNATLEQKVEDRTRELEEAHAALRHNEKLSALGRLAASVAHDINNPLSSILTYLYLLKQDTGPDAQMTEDLTLIERQVNVIANLVKQLRDFSKPTQQQRRAIALQDVIDDVIMLTSKDLEKRNIEVAGHYSPALPDVHAAADQMSEILLNMVVNARDAMPDGGKLTLEAYPEDDSVVLKVTDTGCGMSQETQDRIFEPFFTTKGEEGTGLGLSICYRIIQEHDGQIAVESEVGSGTTFTITLPQAKEKLTA